MSITRSWQVSCSSWLSGCRRPPVCNIGYINLSGGVGIPYRPEQTENDIMAIGEGVRKKFEEILVPAGMGDVAIFTEMGRFYHRPLRRTGGNCHP